MDLTKLTKLKIGSARKYVLISGAVVLCAALLYRFWPDLSAMISPKAEIELKQTKIIKYRKMVAFGQDLGQKLEVLNKGLARLESRLLSGKTESLAAVEIQKNMQEIAANSGLEVRSVNVLEPENLDQKDYVSIPVDFYFYPNIRELKEMLYRIESSKVFLKVIKLTTQYHANPERRFRCHITLAGLMKRRQTSEPGP
ncbi:MAG: hypothetical protein K9M96_09005 [Deltaproteobacteria bacterium]|nr:hypothetical protein [Deltaproteobacteria bacterium]